MNYETLLKHRILLFRIILLLVFVTGAYRAWLVTGLVLNKSYMTTLEVLGPDYATTELWLGFWGYVAMAVFSAVVFALSFRRNRK